MGMKFQRYIHGMCLQLKNIRKEGYNGMNERQLAERIGNIDDRLIQQAESYQITRKQRRAGMFKRIGACAAALVFALGSFTLGRVVEADRVVQRGALGIGMVSLNEIGLGMMLPEDWGGSDWDDWNNGFGVEPRQDGSYSFYSKEIREACMEADDSDFVWGGVLFTVVRRPGQMTEEQVAAEGKDCIYIAATRSGTYLLYYAEDVQYTPETEEKYLQLKSGIKEIRFIVGDIAADALSLSKSGIEEDKFEGTVAGIVKSVSGDSITVDIVEYIDEDDTGRLKELGVTEDDMWDGFYIYDPDSELTTWQYSEDAVFTFIDWAGEFTGSPYPIYHTTTSRTEFCRYVEPYTDGGWILLFFKVEDGKVQYVLERPIM